MPSRYTRVSGNSDPSGGMSRLQLPTYERFDSLSQESSDLDFDITSDDYGSHHDTSSHVSDEMDFQDLEVVHNGFQGSLDKIVHIRHQLNRTLIRPVQRNVIEPLHEIHIVMNNEIERYVNKFGNPLIVKRFLYIMFMTLLLWIVVFFGDLPTGAARGSKGVFSNERLLIEYSKKIIDIAQFETDLEYISSTPHASGTKGDVLLKNYVKDVFKNGKLDDVFENELITYSNYPTNNSKLSLYHKNDKEVTKIDLNEDNYNPLSVNGKLKKLDIIYGHYGTDEELKQLHKISVFNKDTKNFILLLKFNSELIISEQILTAQKYHAKAIIFISQNFNDNKDIVQRKSAGLPQFATGDILSPGYYGTKINGISPEDSQLLPNIPIITLTRNQGELILSKLSNKGLLYKDGKYSGTINDLKVDLEVDTTERRRQPLFNIIGRIDGREQNDKAIIVGATRSIHGPGATYPNFGTAALLNLIRVFQDLQNRFDWKPLRSIYFASFGGSEFNFAGSTEQVELDALPIKDGVYSYLDISQLGLTDKVNVQSNPLMSSLFQTYSKYMSTFNVTTHPIQQYGDWIPFMANGVPSAVISSPNIKDRKLPVETFADTFDLFHELLNDKENQENLKELLFYMVEIILRLIDEPIIPFDVLSYVQEVDTSLQSMLKLYKQKVELNIMIRNILKWKKIGQEWNLWHNHWKDTVWKNGRSSENLENKQNRLHWNDKLGNIDKYFCYEYGLPDRNFFKNMIFGPPLWTEKFIKSNDYNPWSFPGIKDAISNRKWKLAQEEIQVIGEMFLDSSAAFMKNLKILI